MTAGYLLDTNVISATAPDRREALPPEKATARAWILAREAELHVPVTAVAEIAVGIGERVGSRAVRRARDLAAWLAALLASYPERVLAFDTEAKLQARLLQRAGRGVGIRGSDARRHRAGLSVCNVD